MYQQIARNKRRAAACTVVFFALWVGIGALVGRLWAAIAPVGVAAGAMPPASGESAGGDVTVGVAVAGLLALGGIVFSLASGDRLVLAASGAKPADPVRYRQVHNLIQALALGEGLPAPAVYVIDDPSPNAFATGVSPNRAAITVTTGLVATMNREELEGVLAHEMSHIKNYDIRLLLVVGTLIGLAGMLAGLIWRWSFLGRRGGRQGQQLAVIALALGLLLSLLAMLFGPLIRLALTRQRESLADVSAVALTRNPVGLIKALRKLQTVQEPMAHSNQAITPMCIDDPRQHHRTGLRRFLDTHPPLADRIAVLERIAQTQAV